MKPAHTTRNAIRIFFLMAFYLAMNSNSSAQSQSYYNGPTIRIGRLEWMAENLNVVKYWDGRPIPEARTAKEWNYYNEHKIGCYCNYDNEACYGSMYGKIYNWYAIKDNVAPHCWRLPSKADFDRLIEFLGPSTAGKKMKATHSWSNDWNGTNQSGFGGFASGCRNKLGYFCYVGRQAFWWTTDARKLNTFEETGLYISINTDNVLSLDASEGFGFYVRCVRDIGLPNPLPCP